MIYYVLLIIFFFFFNDTATTEIYTLSLHDALPISSGRARRRGPDRRRIRPGCHRPERIAARTGGRASPRISPARRRLPPPQRRAARAGDSRAAGSSGTRSAGGDPAVSE